MCIPISLSIHFHFWVSFFVYCFLFNHPQWIWQYTYLSHFLVFVKCQSTFFLGSLVIPFIYWLQEFKFAVRLFFLFFALCPFSRGGLSVGHNRGGYWWYESVDLIWWIQSPPTVESLVCSWITITKEVPRIWCPCWTTGATSVIEVIPRATAKVSNLLIQGSYSPNHNVGKPFPMLIVQFQCHRW